MKIAFTYNLQLSTAEEEAEFDRPETIQAIADAFKRLGHQVELVEVSGPASRIVARLEALKPQLVFNTAEGRFGRYREAFYPGLFDQLSLPYTGSDAYVCTLTLDKQMTKMAVAAHGIPTPGWQFVDDLNNWQMPDLKFPVIVKPNFEGSSKGITQDSIVEQPENLRAKIDDMLQRYPTGLIVEEYIDGKDVTVPFLELASPKTGGVLPAAEYQFTLRPEDTRKYNIYDFTLKQVDYNAVSVKAPADLTKKQATEIADLSRKIYSILGIRDLGRIDYRVTPTGDVYFIEVNALPSLEPGASIYLSAELANLKTMDAVLNAVLRSAARRQGIEEIKARNRRRYRVGLTYNLKRIKAQQAGDDDSEAEYDAWSTVEAIGNAIESYGYEVVYLEATPELPTILPASQLDFVFNIAEGIQGRNRESQVPAILELLDIPYTGSDPATLSITLDKALSKKILTQAGIPNPEFFVMRTGKDRLPKQVNYPMLLKPVAEGSSKGVMGANVVENEEQLREMAARLIEKYKQPVLVEQYLPGREFTLGLLGEVRPKVLPPMEIVYVTNQEKFPVYTFEHKLAESSDIRYDVPAQVEVKLQKQLERVARGAFIALGCRDVARIDLRLDQNGKAHFIECNPLPGLTPGWSDLCLIAQGAGIDYRTLVGEIMAPAIRRLREKEKQALRSQS